MTAVWSFSTCHTPTGMARAWASNEEAFANTTYARVFREGSPSDPGVFFGLPMTPQTLSGWVRDPDARAKYVEAFERSSFEGMLNYYKRNYPDSLERRRPQTNGICERFHRTVQDEFYKVAFRRKIYTTLDGLQVDVDTYLLRYNTERTHQGKRCEGRTPMQTFLDSRTLAWEKKIA